MKASPIFPIKGSLILLILFAPIVARKVIPYQNFVLVNLWLLRVELFGYTSATYIMLTIKDPALVENLKTILDWFVGMFGRK